MYLWGLVPDLTGLQAVDESRGGGGGAGWWKQLLPHVHAFDGSRL